MNQYKYSEIKLGLSEQFEIRITPEHMDMFRKITGDVNPLHADDDFAKLKGFKEKVVFGMLSTAFLSTLAGVYLPGENSIIHNVEIQFSKPVFVGDTLTVTGTVNEKNDAFNLIFLKVSITNQYGEKVSKGVMRIGILNE
jgi:3-hydroxybutyryl-CoA dehydratase